MCAKVMPIIDILRLLQNPIFGAFLRYVLFESLPI